MPTITMQDGRAVEFSEKAKASQSVTLSPEGIVVAVDFINGESRSFTMPFDHPLFHKSAAHGIGQKFGDARAGLQDVEDCVEAFDSIAAQLGEGNWTDRAKGDGLAGTSVLARALVEVTKQPIEQVKALLATLSPAEKQAVRRTEPVAGVVTRIEAERASKGKPSKVDIGSALAKLGLSAA